MKLSDGAELWTTSSGSGPAVVTLHGGPGLWDYFDPIATMIDRRHTVIRFDQRGCGWSSPSDGPYTVAQAVDDLEQLREFYGIERWHVLGHSWGAELALHYAAAHPERTTGVTYLAGVGAGNDYLPGYRAEFERRLGQKLARYRELGSSTHLTPDESRERTMLSWSTEFSPSSDIAALTRLRWDTRREGVRPNDAADALWDDRNTIDLLALASTLLAPVTIIQGKDDPRPWRSVDSLAAALPNVRRIVIDGAGHTPWRERRDEVEEALADAMRFSDQPQHDD